MKKNNFIKNFINGLKNLFKTNKKLFFTSIFAIVVLSVLLVFSVFSDAKKENQENSHISAPAITEYSEKIEAKLVSLISSLEEVNSVSAFVMVDSTPTTQYLMESEESSSPSDKGTLSTKSETVVFEKNGSVSTPVVVTVIAPKITGVLIVVNKISASTKLSIINSISVVLNVPESCISILQEQ